MGLRCNIDNLRLFGPISGHEARVNNKVDLYSYLRFCGDIMCTAGPKNNVQLTEATGIDASGFDMLNDGNSALFLDNGGCCGSTWRNMKNCRFCSHGTFGDKNHQFQLTAEQ